MSIETKLRVEMSTEMSALEWIFEKEGCAAGPEYADFTTFYAMLR